MLDKVDGLIRVYTGATFSRYSNPKNMKPFTIEWDILLIYMIYMI